MSGLTALTKHGKKKKKPVYVLPTLQKFIFVFKFPRRRQFILFCITQNSRTHCVGKSQSFFTATAILTHPVLRKLKPRYGLDLPETECTNIPVGILHFRDAWMIFCLCNCLWCVVFFLVSHVNSANGVIERWSESHRGFRGYQWREARNYVFPWQVETIYIIKYIYFLH